MEFEGPAVSQPHGSVRKLSSLSSLRELLAGDGVSQAVRLKSQFLLAVPQKSSSAP